MVTTNAISFRRRQTSHLKRRKIQYMHGCALNHAVRLIHAVCGLWIEVGGSMIAIDTLVHNFLHRTGILHRFNANHTYGLACYRAGGCADIIQAVATHIDARQFNASLPKTCPRFVQHAIWRYCSLSGLDLCNGNRIDDSDRCENKDCRLRLTCDRVALR
jgi:hypothetical protein